MAPAPPNNDLASDPKSLYRRGLAQSHRGELLALQTLSAALDGMRKTQDAPDAALAAAALLITGQCMSNYRRFREHAAALAGRRDESLHFIDREDDLVAQTGLLCSLLFLNPSDDLIDDCVARILALLELDIDPNARYAAGRLVIHYTEPREKRELGQRVYGLLQPLAEHRDLTPHRRRWPCGAALHVAEPED